MNVGMRLRFLPQGRQERRLYLLLERAAPRPDSPAQIRHEIPGSRADVRHDFARFQAQHLHQFLRLLPFVALFSFQQFPGLFRVEQGRYGTRRGKQGGRERFGRRRKGIAAALNLRHAQQRAKAHSQTGGNQYTARLQSVHGNTPTVYSA